MRGIFNCTGVRKLTISVPQATQLCPAAVTADSTVTPFTTSLNNTMQLSFMLQPTPHPAKPMAAPGATQFGTAGFSSSFCKWQFGSYCCASQCLPFPLSFPQMNLRLPTWQEEEGDGSYAVTGVDYGNMLQKQRRLDRHSSFQNRILRISKHLSNCSVKSSTMVKLEARDFSKENWKNTPLQGTDRRTFPEWYYSGFYCSKTKPVLSVKEKPEHCFGQGQGSQRVCL